MQVVDWQKIELVVFDVDGTLYNQKLLRKKMLSILMKHFLLRPWELKELWILYHFRKEREAHAGFIGAKLEQKQYEWCQIKTKAPLLQIKAVVDKWILTVPNKFLLPFVFPGVAIFFAALKKAGIAVATLSDYPAKAKMDSMKLISDLNISATDLEVNALKPDSEGLRYLLKRFNIDKPENCLFIGDRQELDGVCAQNIGVQFLLVEESAAVHNFYLNLLDQFNALKD